MTAAVLTAQRSLSLSLNQARRLGGWRLLLPVLPLALAALDPTAGRIVVETLSEAYLQVSVFVAATLLLFDGLERRLGMDTAALLARPGWQVPGAALLGALPGCGGAILVMTQYVTGRLSFGSVVAVLTATMGDAAFLLLAREPATGVLVLVMGLGAGTLAGLAVDRLHGPDFLRVAAPGPAGCRASAPLGRGWRRVWLALFAPGLVLGVLQAFQVDADSLFGPLARFEPALWLGAVGAVLSILIWGYAAQGDPGKGAMSGGVGLDQTVQDTSFVTVWVLLAFLSFELGSYWTGLDLAAGFGAWGAALPLMGVLVGLLPGCGPQIVVTTLYLNGVVPLSVQMGNALSNDGDALFPAIALAPRTALVATLYSAVPALVVAYGWHFLG